MAAGAARRAEDLADAVRMARGLAGDAAALAQASQAALDFAAAHRGAAARTADAIVGVVEAAGR